MYRGGDGAKARGSGKGSKKYKNQNQKKGNMAQFEGSSSRGIVQMVPVIKKEQPKKHKGGPGSNGKRPRGEGRSVCNARIVVEIISCVTTRNGKKLRRNSIFPQAIESPAPFAHTNRPPGWNPWTISQQRGRRPGNVIARSRQ